MPEPDPDLRALRDLTASPVNPLPASVWLALLAVIAIEAVLTAASMGFIGGPQGLGWRVAAIERFAFSGAIQDWMLETRRAPLRHLFRYLSYPWVQPGPLAALLAVAMLAGLGKAVAEGLGTRVFLGAVLLAPPLAAAVFGLVLRDDPLAWLIGAMPMVLALVGAYTWLLWQRAGDDRRLRRRAFSLIALLMLARLGFGLLAEAGHGWIADLAAFTLGFWLAALLRPGGPGMALRFLRMRHRTGT